MTSLQLYKYLLRQCEKLPSDACKHYKFYIKQVRLMNLIIENFLPLRKRLSSRKIINSKALYRGIMN